MYLGWLAAGLLAGSFPLLYIGLERRRGLRGREEEGPSLSIILVLRDMEGRVEGILREVLGFQGRHFPRGQVVVVNDGSQDQTGAILRRMSRRAPRLKVLSLLPGGGVDPCRVGLDLADGRDAWVFVLPPEIHPDDLVAALERALRGRYKDPLLEWMRFQKTSLM